MDLCNARHALLVPSQHPAPQDSSERQQLWKPLLGQTRYGDFCPLQGQGVLPAELMQDGSEE
jgi:hypothetical protein